MASEGYFIVRLWGWEGHMSENWRGRFQRFGRVLTAAQISDLPTLVKQAPAYWERARWGNGGTLLQVPYGTPLKISNSNAKNIGGFHPKYLKRIA